MVIEEIKNELKKHKEKEDIFKVGYIKEFLQTIIIKEIYELWEAKNLIFYWWTAIRFLFNLNRLSEDLDFVWKWFNDFELLWEHLQKKLEKYNLIVDYKLQKFRITLKFRNLLDQFNLQYWNSKDLYIKIEISDHIGFCKNFETKIYPIFKYNQSLVIKSFDQSTLFSTKLNAVLYRQWAKNKNTTNIKVKGRDFYDLFRYLQKNIQPNIDCIKDVENIKDLKEKLVEVVKNIDFKDMVQDIENFVEDDNMIEFIENHWKEYILEKIEEWK